jgi:purine-binding chemotaxis protein CheW
MGGKRGRKPEEEPKENEKEKRDKPEEDEGVEVFDLEIIDDEPAEHTRPAQLDKAKEKKKSETVQLIGFYLDESLFGIDISNILEIIKYREITPLPESPPYVKGILNLRGKVIPVFSLRSKFGLYEKEEMEKGRIIVIENQSGDYGIIVDSVTEVLRIENNDINPTPELISGVSAEYIEGIVKLEETILIVLNINRIFSREEDINPFL